jgi:hypothetical protein
LPKIRFGVRFLIVRIINIGILKLQTQINFRYAELFFYLFIIYVITKDILTNKVDINEAAYLLFVAVFCNFLTLLFSKSRLPIYSYVLLYLTCALLLIYLFVWCGDEKEISQFFGIHNKSIFSILLASQITFALPQLSHHKDQPGSLKIIHYLCMIIIAASLLLLFLTGGRAGWIGFMAAMIYIAFRFFNVYRIKKLFAYIACPFVVLICLLLFWYKPDSSRGRMLIYKISAGMLKDNRLTGIGYGQFKVKYNECQAVYFSSHNIDSKEALLADNSFMHSMIFYRY